HCRADARQDGGSKAQGEVGRRFAGLGLRRRCIKQEADEQRGRSRTGSGHLCPLSAISRFAAGVGGVGPAGMADPANRDRGGGWRTKQTRTGGGHVHGGRPFTRSSLYRLLTNVTYVGQVRYRNEIHPGEQPAIIEPTTWLEVQALLAQNGPGWTGTERTPSEAWLQGLLFSPPCGVALPPS